MESIFAPRAEAIPTFARKYKTSCATCHIAFPRLNAFGRAFMWNGYQFPGGTDAEYTKEEQVKMGAEAYKRVFPNAIWPNSLPGASPFAMIIEAEAVYDTKAPTGAPRILFDKIPGEVEFLAGGNFQDNISWFAELEIIGGEAELEMAHISFDNILPNQALSLKVGKIVPYIMPISNMRRMSVKYWMATRPLGDNQWNFDRTQRGFEARGVLGGGRFAYSAGLVEGRGNEPNGNKDFYLHAGYKLGGLRLDGITAEKTTKGASQPWEDNSVRLDVYFYRGVATLTGGQEDKFTQVGGSIDSYYRRLNLTLGLAQQHDDRPVIGQTFDGIGTHFFANGYYLLYPWLFLMLRYERFTAKLGNDKETEQRFVPGIVALIRANVKVVVTLEIEKEAEVGKNFETRDLEFALMFGF